MANKPYGTLYLGVTSNLVQRAYHHRNGLMDGFSKKYDCKMLVWYQLYDDLQEARATELRMKKWNRNWKIDLVNAFNPHWDDLYERIIG